MRTVITILLATCLNWCFAQESKFTFVFLNTRTDKPELQKEELDELMKGHLANIRRLVKEGKMIMAGPFDGGGGIFIMNSNSVDSVKNWLKTDPGIK
ncbi:MAG TPA: YciI family protein, partial [Cyclobacteriaceae bacterium]|nr:YciI family protein [Cyclobacteriaceae bacterium]